LAVRRWPLLVTVVTVATAALAAVATVIVVVAMASVSAAAARLVSAVAARLASAVALKLAVANQLAHRLAVVPLLAAPAKLLLLQTLLPLQPRLRPLAPSSFSMGGYLPWVSQVEVEIKPGLTR
jgi:hypothetical protein